MQPRSKRERFYQDVGEAMSMTSTRSYINLQTLGVEFNASEMDFIDGEEDEEFGDPDKYLQIETATSSESFRVLEEFVETVKDRKLQIKLLQALEGKKPFANFKIVVDNSTVRQAWFAFKDNHYTEMAKEWIENNVPDELKKKIKQLPAVFIA